jgi:hypothetical protein
MSDFGTMKRRIAREIKRGEILADSTAVGASIVSAIQFFETRRFHFNEFEGELKTTVQSVTAVTLSTINVPQIVTLDSVRMVIGQRDYPIMKMPWHRLESIDSGQYYGYPEMYSIRANQVRLYPPPQDTYPMRWAGLKKLEEVSLGASDAASNAWVLDAEEMIRLKAKANIFRDELRNPNLARAFDQDAENAQRQVKRETAMITGSGRVLPTRF